MENNTKHTQNLTRLKKEKLIQLLVEQQEKMVALSKENQELQWYKEQVMMLKKLNMGVRSEKLGQGQLNLFNEIEECSSHPAEDMVLEETKPKKKKKSKEADYSKLPTKIIHKEIEDKSCVVCDGGLQELAPIIVEELQYQPARYTIVKTYVHQYICPACTDENLEAEIISAEGAPKKLIKGSVVTPSVIAGVAFNKFVSGIPLYRQEQELQRKHIPLSRSNLSNWLSTVGSKYLSRIYEVMLADMRQCEVIHMDETTLTVLQDKKEGRRSKSYEWVMVSGKQEAKQMALYDYHPSREHQHAADLLGDSFRGYVHADGYEAYHNLEGITTVGCMAHARRKFKEAYGSIAYP